MRLYFPHPQLVNDLGQNLAATGGVAENDLTCASPTAGADFEGYEYDANSNRTKLRLRGQSAQYPNGQEIVYHYDSLDRECFKDLPSLVANPLGCGSAVAGAGAADVFSDYDLAGRRVSARFGSTSRVQRAIRA